MKFELFAHTTKNSERAVGHEPSLHPAGFAPEDFIIPLTIALPIAQRLRLVLAILSTMRRVVCAALLVVVLGHTNSCANFPVLNTWPLSGLIVFKQHNTQQHISRDSLRFVSIP